jgi:CubicO group peptidase (beta-lactamase class C family)
MFSTSARDMARYGLLYLNKGQWDNKQILSEEWINKSWDPVNIEMYYTLKFGFMWWIFEDGTIYVNKDMGFEENIYFTSGDGGHITFVIPYLDLVVVHRMNEKGVDFWSQFKRGPLGIGADVDDDEVYNLRPLCAGSLYCFNKIMNKKTDIKTTLK